MMPSLSAPRISAIKHRRIFFKLFLFFKYWYIKSLARFFHPGREDRFSLLWFIVNKSKLVKQEIKDLYSRPGCCAGLRVGTARNRIRFLPYHKIENKYLKKKKKIVWFSCWTIWLHALFLSLSLGSFKAFSYSLLNCPLACIFFCGMRPFVVSTAMIIYRRAPLCSSSLVVKM